MDKSAVVFTLGQQDVQVLVEYKGKKYLAKPSKDFVHEFTEKLSNDEVAFKVMPIKEFIELLNEAESENREIEKLTESKKEFTFRSWSKKDSNKLKIEVGEEILEIPIVIAFPMIYKAIYNIEKKILEFYTIDEIRILYTERGRAEEPVGVTELVRPVLCDYLKINEDDIIGTNVLSPFKFYDAYAEGYGQTVKPEIANTILNIFRHLKDEVGVRRVYVSSRSGIPKISETIREAVNFIFDEGQYEDISSNNEKQGDLIRFCPIESLKNGLKVKKLIKEGNLEGALALCKIHYSKIKTWPIIKYLDLINSILVNGRDYIPTNEFDSLKETKIWFFLKEYFFYHPYSATIRAVFRIEQYLQRQDFVNALKNIFTIIDIASWEFINNETYEKVGKRFLSFEERDFSPKDMKESGLFGNIFEKYKVWEKPRHSFSWTVAPVDETNEKSRKIFPMELFLKALNFSSLCRMRKILVNSDVSDLRNARNAATHGCINYSQISRAIEVLKSNKIICEKSNGELSFMRAPIVADVIRYFMKSSSQGKANEETLYKAYEDFHKYMLLDIESLIFEQ